MSFPSHPTASIETFFVQDHRACDEAWAEVEAADPAELAARFAEFDRQMRRHMDWEESVLFPAFEARSGGFGGGPTQVMRSEHQGMRGLLDQMAESVAAGDHGEVIDLGDTLMMLIQQHNLKEEQVLYPMMSMALGGAWPELLARLRIG